MLNIHLDEEGQKLINQKETQEKGIFCYARNCLAKMYGFVDDKEPVGLVQRSSCEDCSREIRKNCFLSIK